MKIKFNNPNKQVSSVYRYVINVWSYFFIILMKSLIVYINKKNDKVRKKYINIYKIKNANLHLSILNEKGVNKNLFIDLYNLGNHILLRRFKLNHSFI